MEQLKILVTGASGFIGSFIVEEGLARGYEVWAAVRKGSSRQFLQVRTAWFLLDIFSLISNRLSLVRLSLIFKITV